MKTPDCKGNKIAPSLQSARKQLAARYLAALRMHLRTKKNSYKSMARSLGRSALASGMVTLDLAIMHEQAMVILTESHDFTHSHSEAIKRAGVFFTRALIPLELDQRAVRETYTHLKQRNATLHKHTAELAKGNRQLMREVARREAGEVVIRQSRAHYQKLLGESQGMQKKLRKLTRQIITAQEDERKVISRELHDEVVQNLVGINVELATLGKGASIGSRTLKSRITHTQRLVENSVSAVHRFARELRPAVLDDLGLIPALHTYTKNLATRKKIKIHIKAFEGVEALSGIKRTVLFRVAQESLTNVARHAAATEVHISLTQIPRAIRMEVRDNGKSFSVSHTLLTNNHKRLGLLGMKERLEMVGGKLTIDSAPDRGTTVRAEIPFSSDKIKK